MFIQWKWKRVSETVSGITSSNKGMSMNSIANVFVLLRITIVSHLLGTA